MKPTLDPAPPPGRAPALAQGPGPSRREPSRLGRPSRRPALAVLLLAGGLALGCGSGSDAPAGPPPGPRAANVETATAQVATLSVKLNAVGSLEADNLVDLKPEIGGLVSAIEVEEGQAVRRGQVLVRLRDEELSAQLEAAAAAEARARTEAGNLGTQVERNRGLLASGAISQQTFDDLASTSAAAAARVREAEAGRALAAERLAKTVVRAPFAGRVDRKSIYPGDFVEAGKTTLFTLVDDDPLRVEFSVPEQYVGRLEPGSEVEVRVRNRPDELFGGKVVFISPRVDPVNRTVALKAEVPNPAGELRAGQFADVELELESIPGALLVPEAAIVSREGESWVFVVEDGKALRRPVRLGERQTGRVQILSGVEAGDTVVVAGQQRIQDQSPVTLLASTGEAGQASTGDAGQGEGG